MGWSAGHIERRFQIGNNRGRTNGWVTAVAVFGKCVRVED